MHRVLLVLSMMSATAAHAAEQKCSALPTANERIVCYDRQFPPDPPHTSTIAHPAQIADPDAERVSQAPSAVSQSNEPVAPHETAALTPAPHGMFDRAEPVSERSTIKALHRRDGQNTVFVLANDQIWRQDSARSLSFRVGDSVTVRSGTFGGYFLTNETGTNTRVRRIQ